MKNLKNTFAAFTMIAVLAFGTTFANAGIIILRSADAPTQDTCSDTKGILDEVQEMLGGIIILRTGIIILKSSPCSVDADKGGIIIL